MYFVARFGHGHYRPSSGAPLARSTVRGVDVRPSSMMARPLALVSSATSLPSGDYSHPCYIPHETNPTAINVSRCIGVQQPPTPRQPRFLSLLPYKPTQTNMPCGRKNEVAPVSEHATMYVSSYSADRVLLSEENTAIWTQPWTHCPCNRQSSPSLHVLVALGALFAGSF